MSVPSFIGLGGTGYAAFKVTGSTVKNGSLTTRDVRNRGLLARDFRPKGLKGPKGDPGPAGPPGNLATTLVDGDIGTAPAAEDGQRTWATSEAVCPPGSGVIGGGYLLPSVTSSAGVVQAQIVGNGYDVAIANDSPVPAFVWASAVCMAGATAPVGTPRPIR